MWVLSSVPIYTKPFQGYFQRTLKRVDGPLNIGIWSGLSLMIVCATDIYNYNILECTTRPALTISKIQCMVHLKF